MRREIAHMLRALVARLRGAESEMLALAWMMTPYLGIVVRTANSEISNALPSLMLKPFMGTCVNMPNTENSEIRILLYKQPPNWAHTMTYVSTYTRHKNR